MTSTARPTRQRIIEKSSELFMQQGFNGSGLKQIAIESGATIGSLYHFFPGGKQELAAETLRASGAAYAQLVVAVMGAAPDIVTAVEWCFAGAAQTLRDSDYADACPIATVALEVASSDEPLRQVTAEIFASWVDGLAPGFEGAGLTRGDAREMAIVLIAALEGGFVLCRAAKDTAAMDAIGRAMATLVQTALSPQRPTPLRSRRRPAGTSR